jgi:RNA polymerase-binding transcription factor DksA
MSANPNTRAIENAADRSRGRVWNCLHSEREDICDALLKEPVTMSGMSNEDDRRAAIWHKELLQARLRKIDDALDRLLSGSYGLCSKCGRWIEDTKLEFDPAIAFCIECWQHEQSQKKTGPLSSGRCQIEVQATPTSDLSHELTNTNLSLAGVAIETVEPLQTIVVRTRNSDYRILILDPRIGRALVEGGSHFAEPTEAMLSGSVLSGGSLKPGWIGIGGRIEMWVNDKFLSTSPVQSVRVEHAISDDHELTSIPDLVM